jgi:hypothetical protein
VPATAPSSPASTGENRFDAKPARAQPYPSSKPAPRAKPILCLDFDGVVHSYGKGWQDGTIYGKPTQGFFEWADEARQHFTLAIFSSRSDSHKNIKPMMDWLSVHLWDWKQDHPDSTLEAMDFKFPDRKPPAFITIDDRALTFNGKWGEFDPKQLIRFVPWNVTPESNTDHVELKPIPPAAQKILDEQKRDPGR